MQGLRVVRSAPWLSLLAASGVAGILLTFAAIAHGSTLTWLTTLLGLSTCGAAAAYVLDEDAAVVADSTPASRGRRTAWRVAIVAVPATVAGTGLVALDDLDPETHWLRLTPLPLGSMALGVALAAAMRRSVTTTPGDLAGSVTLVTTVLVVLIDPTRHWATLIALDDRAHVGRTVALWTVLIAASVVTTVVCTRDPARPHNSQARTRSPARHPRPQENA